MKIQKRHLNVFSEFKKSLERQYKENKQLQKDVKLLQQQSNSIIDSTPVKTATSTIKQTNKVVKMVGHVVGSAVKQTTDTRVFKAGSEAISKSAQAVSDITHKVLNFNRLQTPFLIQKQLEL